jgi:hypothetical protein
MKSALQRKIACLETALIRMPSTTEQISGRSFIVRLKQRQQIKGETFEQAAEALVRQLPDWELAALIGELEASIARSSESGTMPATTIVVSKSNELLRRLQRPSGPFLSTGDL